MTARAARRVVAIAALVLALLGAAFAHEDVRIVDASVHLAPGEELAYPAALHFHRVVGRYAVVDSVPGLSLRMVAVGPGESGGAEDIALASAPAGHGSFNRLIPCCLERAYSGYHLRVRNDGVEPATLELRAWAVHDDFAVVVHRAESGAVEVPLGIFLALGVAAGLVAWNDRRRAERAAFAAPAARLPASFWWSAGLFAAACAVAFALGIAGALRYDAGPVDGMVAILADLPLPGGPFGARDALVMGVLLLVWATAIACWIRTVHRGAHRRSPWPARLGVALGLVSLLAGAALGWTYGRVAVPLGLGLVLGAPLAAIALGLPGAPSRRGAPRPAR